MILKYVTGRGKWAVLGLSLALLASLLLFSPVRAFAAEPEKDSRDTEADVTFTAGILEMKNAPVLSFGSHPISSVKEEYEAARIDNNVQVSDLRGNGGGWGLTVALSRFHLQNTDTETLDGAYITVTNSDVAAVNGNLSAPPATDPNLVLEADGSVTNVLKADPEKGLGVWDLNWKTDSTKLTVLPGTAQEGVNVADMNWLLQAAP